MSEKIKQFFINIYKQLIGIADSPHKIAGGFALGVFLGVLPGAGPMASIALAFIFRLNKAAAFVGSLLTNTWFSLVAFVAAVKIGSAVLGLSWGEVYNQCQLLMKNFHWRYLIDVSLLNILKPLFVGYAVIAGIAAIIAYIIIRIVLFLRRKKKHHDLDEI